MIKNIQFIICGENVAGIGPFSYPAASLIGSTSNNSTSNQIAITNKPKILCLHGKGETSTSLHNDMHSIRVALSNYEFIFPDGGYVGVGGGRVWIPE